VVDLPEVVMSTEPGPGWTVGRVVSAALGAVLLLIAYAMVTGGVALLWSDHGDREDGYVWSPDIPGVTEGHAITSDDIHHNTGGLQAVIDAVVSEVRLEVTPSDPTDVLFVGVASSADAEDYLHDVAHRQVGDIAQGGQAWGWLGPGVTTERSGGPPDVPPGDMDIWLAETTGAGTRTLTWPRPDGDWVVVVMQEDGARGISVAVRTGAAAPDLGWIAAGMVIVGIVALGGGALLMRRTLQRVRQTSATAVAGQGDGQRAARTDDEAPVLVGR
jgi:hypothetical protein